MARQTGDEETRQSSGVAKKVEDDRGVGRLRSIREGGRNEEAKKKAEKTGKDRKEGIRFNRILFMGVKIDSVERRKRRTRHQDMR